MGWLTLLWALALIAHPQTDAGGNTSDCRDVLTMQVLLNRHGFSAGEIDGRAGANTRRALAAFQQSQGLPSTGAPDCETFEALGPGTPVTVEYTLTDADMAGPFVEDMPEDLMAQSALPSLGYRSPLERLAERFHMSPELFTRLNPRVTLASGTVVVVPAVDPFDPGKEPAAAQDASGVRIEVTREDSALRVWSGDGSLLFFAPVTVGSEHDPLPIGEWSVTAVGWLPTFHYNPELFWDADPSHAKAVVKPGPNNPVGVVWIDINVEHYGLHGTPEPSRVGHTSSHGCVRLTNWDAARLTAFAARGTPVIFR